ncbi:hypothetical protein [uncultured Ruegeria sp.]|uniref:hypothetical protein n=1 Tax=uncultured Ruegeria sp. TaxID=259304 RepID=UPI002619FCEF|nr:hypothetical protein [uncultured Ruegeria sp.]
MDFESVGVWVRDLILNAANMIVDEYWPGLISAGLIAIMTVIVIRISGISKSRRQVLIGALKDAERAADATGHGLDIEALRSSLARRKGKSARALSTGFSEYCETLTVVGRGDSARVHNSIRPSAFLNVDDLGFSLKSWRWVPGVFVSVGLLLTFLGLVAVLQTSKGMLRPEDNAATMAALQQLLGQASAKFVMSLSGLACSIVLNLVLRFWSARVELAAEEFAAVLEKNMAFISLEDLASKQLRAIEDQTVQQAELNTHLVAKISEPLNRVVEQSVQNVGTMVDQLGKDITSGIGGSLNAVSERMEAAANSLSSIGDNLNLAARQFDDALSSSTKSLTTALSRLEEVSEKLTNASGAVGELAPTVLETVKEGNAAKMRVAEGATEMVHAAKAAISEEKKVVLEAMQSISGLIEAFESRAVAYDGQLEKAFETYQSEVGKTIDKLEDHGNGVQERFADALSTLQAVIENAKAFEPESQIKSGPEALVE